MFMKANWIWEERNETNSWVCFRRSFTLEKLPVKCITQIAVETKYWLYINGKLVIFDGGLNRESLPGCGYYDEIDLAAYLHEGVNTIAVLCWFWNNEGRNNNNSGAGGFLFCADEIGIYSDSDWRVLRHPAYGETKEPLPSYLYAGHNIGFDARLDIVGWQYPEYNDSEWASPRVMGKVPCEPWNMLYKRPIPQFVFSDYKPYVSIEKTGNKYICALPYNAHVTPYLKVKAPAGLVIDIRTDRYVVHGGPGDHHNEYNSHRTEYITKEGVQEFEALDWMLGEQMIYTVPEGVEVLAFSYRESGYDTKFAGDFKCDNAQVNRLVEKCKRTLYVCMRENYMDCPDRERGQWTGDINLQIIQAFYCLDRKADMLTQKALHDFINLRKGDRLVCNVPGVNFTELPPQSLSAISEFGMFLGAYYYLGDKSILAFSYPAIIRYLKLWEMGKNGLVLPRNGDWRWFDHLDHIDEAVMENCWYYSSLKAAKKIAAILGISADNSFFDERMQSIQLAFDEQFLKSNGYRSGEFLDDRANAMVILAGLAASDQGKQAALNVLYHVENATPYMEYYVLLALFSAGEPQQAMERMLRRYQPLIDNENSTLWEDFKILGTKNHAWSGGPLTLLYQYAAGITPLKPGFEVVSIRPLVTGLNNINASMESVKGQISVQISFDSERYFIKVTLPSAVSGKLSVPKGAFSDGIGDVIIDGQIVHGVDDGTHITFNVPGGDHELLAVSRGQRQIKSRQFEKHCIAFAK